MLYPKLEDFGHLSLKDQRTSSEDAEFIQAPISHLPLPSSLPPSSRFSINSGWCFCRNRSVADVVLFFFYALISRDGCIRNREFSSCKLSTRGVQRVWRRRRSRVGVGRLRYVDRPSTCEVYLRVIWVNSSTMLLLGWSLWLGYLHRSKGLR